MVRASIQQKVGALGELSRPQLVELWANQYGCPPPSGVRQPLLVRSAAWHLQERQLGGLCMNAKRLLKTAMKGVEASLNVVDETEVITAPVDGATQACGKTKARKGDGASEIGPRPLPLPGARLIREWNGRRYVVEVLDSGFVMDGKPYRSLTAIAFRITGAKWSGPRFFGL